MSNDVECPICGIDVCEKSIREGRHKCDPEHIADSRRELEQRVSDLESEVAEIKERLDALAR